MRIPKIGTVIALAVTVLMLLPAYPIGSRQFYGANVSSEYPIATSSPIKIESDAAMDNAASTNGWSGSGVKNDPYVINNVTIDAVGGYSALFLKSVTRHTLILNSTFYNATKTNVYPYDQATNIHIEDCRNITVKDSRTYSGSNGIFVLDSDDISILNITTWDDASIWGKMNRNMIIDGCDLSDRSSISISGKTVNLKVSNNTIRDTQFGIAVASDAFLIENNRIMDCEYGIGLASSYYWSHQRIQYNNITGARIGVQAEKPSDFYGNHIEASETGIFLGRGSSIYHPTTKATVQDNEIISEDVGLDVFWMGAYIIGNRIWSETLGMDVGESSDQIGRGHSFDIIGNHLFKGGMRFINHDLIMNFSSNNTLNGYPIYLYSQKDLSDEVFPNDAGQVVIDRCTNVSISGLKNLGSIYACSTDSVSISECLVKEGGYGIRMDMCYDAMIIGCRVTGTNYGIMFWNGNGTVSANYIESSRIALNCMNSHNSMITNNSMWNASVSTRYAPLQVYDQKNTVNGKPVLFLKDIDLGGAKLPENIGMLICNNAQNFMLSNASIRTSTNFLSILYCRYIELFNCSAENMYEYGMFICESDDIVIRECEMTSCDVGLFFYYPCKKIDILKCDFINNTEIGLDIGGARFCRVYNCSFLENRIGLFDMTFTPEPKKYTDVVGNIFLHQKSFAINIANDERFFNNSFIENNLVKDNYGMYNGQVDPSDKSQWYNTALKLGNYWSNLTGADSDMDGVFDTSYKLNTNENPRDNYPLTYCPHISPCDPTISGYQGDIILEWDNSSILGLFKILGPRIMRCIEGGPFILIEKGPVPSERYVDNETVPGKLHSYFSRTWAGIEGSQWMGFGHASMIVSEYSDPYAPLLDIIEPEFGAFLPIENVTMSWVLEENITEVTNLEFSLDGEGPIPLPISSNRYTLHHLSEGPHSLIFWTIDIAMNSLQVMINFTIDYSEPFIEILEPSDGVWFNTSSVNVSWNVYDNVTEITKPVIKVDNDSMFPLSGDGREKIYLKEGRHLISISVSDKAGNKRSDHVEIGVDTSLPWVSPFHFIPVPGTTCLLVEWRAGDLVSGPQGSVIIFEGEEYDVLGRENWTTPPLENGEHQGVFRIWDLAGNFKTAIIEMPFVDFNPPHLEILSPREGKRYNTSDIQVTWEAGDDERSIGSSEISLDSGPWCPTFTDVYNFTDLSDGPHHVEVSVVDLNGNAVSRNVTFIIDTISPVITFRSPAGAGISIDETIVLEFSEVLDPSAFVMEPFFGDHSLVWENNDTRVVILMALEYGRDYLFTISGTDLAGNHLEDSLEFSTVDLAWVRGRIVIDGAVSVSELVLSFDDNGQFEIGDNGEFTIETASGDHVIQVFWGEMILYRNNITLLPGQELDLNEITVSIPDLDEDHNVFPSMLLFVLIPIFIVIVLIIIAAIFIFARSRKKDPSMPEIVHEEERTADPAIRENVQDLSTILTEIEGSEVGFVPDINAGSPLPVQESAGPEGSALLIQDPEQDQPSLEDVPSGSDSMNNGSGNDHGIEHVLPVETN